MPESDKDTPERKQRVAKWIARAGLASRRDAERWIAEGRVSIDGKVIDTPAIAIEEPARISVDGKPLPEADRARLWRYHKPSGLVTTTRDERGRPTVFERLPAALPRVISIGRLDLNSEGLLLLTNDGELARHLEHPDTGWVRRYRVRVHGTPTADMLATLAKGATVDGVRYGPIQAELDRQQGSNAWITMALREGKNREVRKVCEHLGFSVTRLIRISYGPFQLGTLGRGEVEEVAARVLREQMGVGRPGGAKPGGGGTGTAKAKERAPRRVGSRRAETKDAEPKGAGPKGAEAKGAGRADRRR